MNRPLVLADGRTLDADTIESFGRELDALHARVVANVGDRDVRYIRRLVRIARLLGIAGRALLYLSFFPPAWVLGVLSLALSKILENMEIGHNILHGQYDFTGDPSLRGDRYEWDMVCPASGWRKTHNVMHHTHTNIVGLDRDLGYGVMRVCDEQPWHPRYLLQPIQNVWMALFFEWGISGHNVQTKPFFQGQKSFRELLEEAKPLGRKAARQILTDYVLFPLLGGPLFVSVLVGNFVANTIRNVWAYVVIFCGHFTEGVYTFTIEETENETRGRFYVRQLLGSSNLDGGPLFHILTGNLSHQIEHHLFPDVPACRYAEMAVEVREIAARHGLPYNTGSLSSQFATVVRRIFHYAVPRPTVERQVITA